MFDLTDPAQRDYVTTVNLAGYANNIAVAGKEAYVAVAATCPDARSPWFLRLPLQTG